MSIKNSYRIQAPNATPVNIVRSWLTAAKIPCNTSHKSDISVEKKGGGTLEVHVVMGAQGEINRAIGRAADAPSDECHSVIRASSITGKKRDVALAAFWEITDAAGYDRVDPIARGAEPKANEKGNPRKLHYRDEDFLVSIRHTEFRRSPNPPADRWAMYKTTMEKCAWAFLRANHDLCRREGINFDDVMQYCRCLVVNFCARYETPEPIHHDNERKCYRFLQQRLYLDRGSSLRAILLKKERSTMPDAETVAIALHGIPDADAEISPAPVDEDMGVDEGYVARHCELDTSSIDARHASASSKLSEMLGALPHDKLVGALTNAASNQRLDPAARDEARRRLSEHVKTCESCNVGAQEDKELAGGDALGAASEVEDVAEVHGA